MNLAEAKRLLLGIIASVEAGVTTPGEAMVEVSELKTRVAEAGVAFQIDYTVEDFQKIREAYAYEYFEEDEDEDFESEDDQ